MAQNPTLPGKRLTGALIGWERKGSQHGCVVTLQIIENAAEYSDNQYHRVSMALNERQLRSPARDLARASQARCVDLHAREPFPKRVVSGLKTMLMG